MRLSNLVSLAIVAPATIAMLSPLSFATTIFNQNFDDTSIFPTGVGISATGSGVAPQGRWARNDSTTPTPTPEPNPVPKYAGDQAMLITRNGGGVTGLLGYLFDDSVNIPSGTFYFQASVYRTDANSSFSINVNNGSLSQSDAPLEIYVDPTGEVSTMYSGGGLTDRGISIPQATWTTFEEVVNMDTGKFDLYATIGNGAKTQVLNGYSYPTGSGYSLSNVNGVAFGPSGTVGNTFYVDDVYLGTNPPPVPEPVTGALVLVGGAILAMRRRRA